MVDSAVKTVCSGIPSLIHRTVRALVSSSREALGFWRICLAFASSFSLSISLRYLAFLVCSSLSLAWIGDAVPRCESSRRWGISAPAATWHSHVEHPPSFVARVHPSLRSSCWAVYYTSCVLACRRVLPWSVPAAMRAYPRGLSSQLPVPDKWYTSAIASASRVPAFEARFSIWVARFREWVYFLLSSTFD